MKLVEVLAKELEKWPVDAHVAVQDNDNDKTIWYLPEGHKEISHSGNEWACDSWFEILISEPSQLAADHATAIVTRAAWEAERAKLKAGHSVDSLTEERAKLKAPKANADGWIRHRGGKCPVEAGTRVSTKYRDGRITLVHHLTADPMASNVSLKTVWGHKKDQYDIMYYKPHKPTEQPALVSEETIKATEPGRFDAIAIRDRIRELDTQRAEVESTYQRQISEITQERESLVQKLAMEGFVLAEVLVQPVDFDPSDKSTWQVGCSVEIESSGNPAWTIRKSLVGVLKFDEEMYHQGWYIDYSGNGHWCISDNTRIKFVSRPAS